MSNEIPLRGFLENPAIPRWFKAVVFFGLPFLLFGGVGAAPGAI
jgi:hypothetical protein